MDFTVADDVLMNDGEPIANFVPRICGIYQSAILEEQLRLLLEVRRGEAQPHILLWTADQLDALNFEKEIPGCLCRDVRGRSTKSLVETYLRMQLSNPDLHKGDYIAQTGWHRIDGEYKYIAGQETTKSLDEQPLSGAPPQLVSVDVMRQHLAIRAGLSEENAVERLLEVFGRHIDVYLPVWGFSIFAACRSFLQDSGMPTACILYLIATQGFGKTATAKALCQLFDDTSGHIADIYDAGSTMSAMERALMVTRDRSVLFDDIYIGTNKAKQRERLANAAALLRFAANETARTKTCGRKNIDVFCSAGLVVTGEIPMEATSDVTRCIIVRIRNRMADRENPVDLNDLRRTAATAMQGFLRWFGAHYEAFRSRIQADADRQLAAVRSAPNDRVKKSLFELYWLLDRFFDYAQEICAISENVHREILQATKKSLHMVWDNINEELRRIDNRPKTIQDAIVSGVQRKELPAFQHKGCICVQLPVLTRYMQKVYGRSDWSDNYVAGLLRQNQLLSMDRSGKSTKKIHGARFVCIPISRLQRDAL